MKTPMKRSHKPTANVMGKRYIFHWKTAMIERAVFQLRGESFTTEPRGQSNLIQENLSDVWPYEYIRGSAK